jgi:hypothetical protein
VRPGAGAARCGGRVLAALAVLSRTCRRRGSVACVLPVRCGRVHADRAVRSRGARRGAAVAFGPRGTVEGGPGT